MCVGSGEKGPDTNVWAVEQGNQADVCKPVYTRLLQKKIYCREAWYKYKPHPVKRTLRHAHDDSLQLVEVVNHTRTEIGKGRLCI